MKAFVINKPKNFELRPNNDANFIDGQHIGYGLYSYAIGCRTIGSDNYSAARVTDARTASSGNISSYGINIISHGPENAAQRNFESSKQKKENKIKTYKKIQNILLYVFSITGLISAFSGVIFTLLNAQLSFIVFYSAISILLVSFVGLIIFDNLIKKT